ncbi:dUTP diphosphatase [Salsuginibacillus kocurii]|uniref:dUTP diphosphatase n=1 Tax=Salsuginibacillus kocurii TaxID=427078 RepID=UPI0003800BA0
MNELFALQKTLDDRILEEHGLRREDLFKEKILALQVEMAELANETRCFKYWSTKPASDRDVILEEYVDGLHFILSLGIDRGVTEDMPSPETVPSSLTEAFLVLNKTISTFAEAKDHSTYQSLFQSYLELGQALGFAQEETINAYREKNETNHQRQNEGY